MKILAIVPAYNESAIIAETIRRIREQAPGVDILAVNDGSTDGTLAAVRETGVSYLDLPLNLGIGGAVQSGYLYAREMDYDYAVQIDGDGQHDPACILPMIRWMEKEGVDVGIGSRFVAKEGFQSSRARRAGIRFLSFLVRLVCGARVKDVTSGLRVANRKFIRVFSEEYSDDYPETDSIPTVVRNGGVIAEYPVIMQERVTGRSSISLPRSFYYMLKVSLSLLLCRMTRPGSTRQGDDDER